MTHIAGEVHIDAPKDRVWDILADLGGIKNFSPGVTDSHYNPGDERGVGASRHCDLKPFGSVEETAILWNEGESYTLRLHDGKRLPPSGMRPPGLQCNRAAPAATSPWSSTTIFASAWSAA